MDIINSIGNVGAINELMFYKTDAARAPKPDVFQKFFDAALKTLDETNADQLVSERLYVDLATGKTDDILAVVLAQSKADASLNFTVQVTGKIIEAYREIMRMQL